MELINHFWVHFYIALPLAVAGGMSLGVVIGNKLNKGIKHA